MKYSPLAAILLAAAAASGCGQKVSPTAQDHRKDAPTSADIDPRSKVIGVTPQTPVPEGPATTSSVKSSVTKAEQSNAMPMPGQANDHSVPTPKPAQKPVSTPK